MTKANACMHNDDNGKVSWSTKLLFIQNIPLYYGARGNLYRKTSIIQEPRRSEELNLQYMLFS